MANPPVHITSPLPDDSACNACRRVKIRRIESFFLRKRLRNDLHKGEQSKICHLFHFLRGKNDHLFRFLPEIHHPEHQVAHREAGGQLHGRKIPAVGGEEDERQTGRDGQHEDDGVAHIGRVIEHPSDVIDCDTNNCGDDKWRETKFASVFTDDEAEARDGQHLEHGADGVRHGCGRIRAQDVVRCGNSEPDEVGEHHQQEEEQAPRVEAETVAGVVYGVHFQMNIKNRDSSSRKLC